MSYLLLINIGPVQPFIASARRTRDLYVGSTLLSELSKAAAWKIADEAGPESLIFPAPNELADLVPGTQLNVANKILAHINTPPSEIALKVEEAIKKHLETIRKHVYEAQQASLSKEDVELAKKQIEDLVEFSWVAVPFKDISYEEARERVEALLSARKNTRYFKPVSWGAPTLKSSIDGQLESVIPDKLYPRKNDLPNIQKSLALQLYRRYGAGPAERLSGVDLLKRRARLADLAKKDSEGKDSLTILSTSHIAALPFLARLNTITDVQLGEEISNKWTNYLNAIQRSVLNGQASQTPVLPVLEEVPEHRAHCLLGRSDGGMLFVERLLEDVPDAESMSPIQQELQGFFQLVDKTLQSTPKVNKALSDLSARPGLYYAILVADGDNMGKAIKHQATSGIEQHRKLSQQLNTFASRVAVIVEKDHEGAKVYAGGDDIMAFLPLHTVLSCAQTLARAFKEELKEFTTEDGVSTPTLSVGITIVHHLELLQDALAIARKTEKHAKAQTDKNALAITVHKRSGEEYTTVGQWGQIDGVLEDLIALYLKKELPGGTAYEIREMAELLKPEERKASSEKSKNEEEEKALREVIQIDTLRILTRKLGVPQQKMSKERKKELLAWFREQLFIHQSGDGNLTVTQTMKIENFIHELLVARVLADAYATADIPLVFRGKGETK